MNNLAMNKKGFKKQKTEHRADTETFLNGEWM